MYIIAEVGMYGTGFDHGDEEFSLEYIFIQFARDTAYCILLHIHNIGSTTSEMEARKQKKMPPSSSARSLGTGTMERMPSKASNSTAILSTINDHDDHDHDNGQHESFVVRFRAFSSSWRQHPSTTTTTTTTNGKTLTALTTTSSSGSSSDDDEDEKEDDGNIVFDTTTDLAYHCCAEQEGSKLILQALTPNEKSAIPDEFMPLRHYRAEKGDITAAVNSIKLTLQWRKEFEVDKIVRSLENADDDDGGNDGNDGESIITTTDLATILRKENETGKIYVRGYDKDGRAFMYMRPGNENTNNEKNNIRHLVFQIEKAVQCSLKNGFSKICLVIDYEGFTIANTPPMSTSRQTLDILQRHYCERMYRAYICNPPFVFRSFYAVIKPFVDPVTKQKVCFCVGDKGLQQIVDDVGGKALARKQLEKCCGSDGNVRIFDSTEYMRLPLAVAFDEEI